MTQNAASDIGTIQSKTSGNRCICKADACPLLIRGGIRCERDWALLSSLGNECAIHTDKPTGIPLHHRPRLDRQGNACAHDYGAI